MHLEVTPLFEKGRRLTDKELKSVVPVKGNVVIGETSLNGRTVSEATCTLGKDHLLPKLIQPTVRGMATIAMQIDGFEPFKTPAGFVYYRQCWHCREINHSERVAMLQ